MKYVTHHGFEFGIDTADWADATDAGRAADKMEDWLLNHDAEQTATLHAALKSFVEDGETSEAFQAASDAGNRIVLEVTKDWDYEPDTGHNCDLVAA